MWGWPYWIPCEPDWNLVQRHFRRYGNPRKTALTSSLLVQFLST
jgi:hypothetical protein